MKKIIILITFLLLVTAVEASIASINVSWQLSTSTLKPSSIATISLTISNPGIDLTSIVIIPKAGPYVKITSGDKIDLDGLSSLSTSQGALSIKVDDDAPSTTSYIYLEVDYYTGTSSYKKTLYIPITIIREPVLQIENINFSDRPEPGKTVTLSFNLKNEGFGNAKDIIISITPNSNFIVPESSGELFINNLNSLETKIITFPITISPEVTIGTTSIPVEIKYYDETRTYNYTESKEIGLKISGNVDFIITVNSYNNFYYGRLGKVAFSISNRGSSPANYISVNAFSEFGSKEFYIGSLDPDDSETIEIPQDLSKTSGKYPIHLTLNYRDKFENSYSVEKFVEVIPTEAQIDYNTYIIALIVLVVAFWIYRRRKK